MPIYDYRCEKCDREYEVFYIHQTEIVPDVCVCGGTLKRIYSNINFVLKGSGWAKDGYNKSETEGSRSERVTETS